MKRWWLEGLLVLSVVSLAAQLGAPSFARWWRRPGAGRVGVGEFSTANLAARHLVYLPRDYAARSDWPLVVFLHGAGERGDDIAELYERGPLAGIDGRQPPAIVAAPQCPAGQRWGPDSVAAFVQYLCGAYRVDRARVYLVGFSLGAHGAWTAAAAHPDLYAAAVPIAGGGSPQHASSLAGLPIWAWSGERDEVVPPSATETMVAAVRAAGGQPKMTIIPGAGHGICEDVCTRDEVWTWMLEQRQP